MHSDWKAYAVSGGLLAIIAVWLFFRHQTPHGRMQLDENYYRDFFENAVEGIFRTTPDGRYVAANLALARIYGYVSPNELLNSLTDIASQLYTDPNRREEFKALMAENDQVTDFVSEIRRHDGSRIWITENARAVRNWSGRVVGYEGTVEDVTAKFEAERMMQEALHRSREANRAKGAFLATMSHELRTPLNAIIGFSEIIEREMLGPITPGSYRDYACDIRISGIRLLATINDILDASRLEGGTIRLASAANEMAPLIADGIDTARQLSGDKREVTVEAVDLPQFFVDGSRIRQCIAKIVTNALKFTPQDGSVAVQARLDTQGGLNLTVRDSGIGMKPEMVVKAMRPFHQLDDSLSRKFSGTGLGLSITKALVELHGGRLSIVSEEGVGTQVTISLPPERTLSDPAGSAA